MPRSFRRNAVIAGICRGAFVQAGFSSDGDEGRGRISLGWVYWISEKRVGFQAGDTRPDYAKAS